MRTRPGLCRSGLSREQGPIVTAAKNALARTTEVGSRNLVWACLHDTPAGAYVADCKIAEWIFSGLVGKTADHVAGSRTLLCPSQARLRSSRSGRRCSPSSGSTTQKSRLEGSVFPDVTWRHNCNGLLQCLLRPPQERKQASLLSGQYIPAAANDYRYDAPGCCNCPMTVST
jgi:hypothetical protein